MVEGTLPVGHVEQAGLRGGRPSLTLLLDTQANHISTNRLGQHDHHRFK